MEKIKWQIISEHYAGTFYLLLLMQVLTLIIMFKGLRTRPRTKLVNILIVYAAASFFQSVLSIITALIFGAKTANLFANAFISIFIIIEVACCYRLVVLGGLSRNQQRYLSALLIAFCVFELLYASNMLWVDRVANIESYVQLPVMMVFCGCYYHRLLTQPPQPRLLQNPLFWAMAGMVILTFLLFPYNLVLSYASHNQALKAIYWTIPTAVYSLVFLTHLKALQCSQQPTQP
jgi:hypothetical protein